MYALIKEWKKQKPKRKQMTNANLLEQLLKDQGHDFEAILQHAELSAQAQEYTRWGLTGRQSDVVEWLDQSPYPYAAMGLAIYYYRTVNGLH